MNTLINALKRAYLLFMIRSLERELHDLREAMNTVQNDSTYMRIVLTHADVRKELAMFRSAYTALLPVGEIIVWPMA